MRTRPTPATWTLLLLASCAKSTTPAPDLNTNWLRACSSDEACGTGLSCVCGVCTTPCTSESDCGSGNAVACGALHDTSLAGQCTGSSQQMTVCLASCASGSDCEAFGAGLVCQTGHCLPTESTDAGMTSADAAAGCGDTQSDPANCGACGHDCLGGQCAAGRCQPIVLASDQDQPGAIAVRDGYVYWTNAGASGAVRRIRVDGGQVESIAEDEYQAGGIALDASHVYWTRGDPGSTYAGSLLRAPLSGGTPELLSTSGRTFPGMVAVDTRAAYWLAANMSVLARSLSDGSESVLVADANASALALAGDMLYWTQWGGGNLAGIMSLRLSGSGIVSNLVSLQDAYGIAVDAEHVYWTELNSGTVMRASLLGDEVTTLAENQPQPNAIAVDQDAVYWTNRGGMVRMLSLAGHSPRTLASEQAGPSAIAVDATAVYWTDTDGRTVMRQAK